jgi:nicotinamide-nucleotide adenylyltransferase
VELSLALETGLFVGRFQPFHLGHLASIKFALSRVNRLIVAVGSAQKSHEHRNPFTCGERIAMIKLALAEASNNNNDKDIDIDRIVIVPVPDVEIHSLWTGQVRAFCPKFSIVFSNDKFTLSLFRAEGAVIVEPPLQNRDVLSGTEIRRRIQSKQPWKHLVPNAVAEYMSQMNELERFDNVMLEKKDSRHPKL